jgi:hypothetical protein
VKKRGEGVKKSLCIDLLFRNLSNNRFEGEFPDLIFNGLLTDLYVPSNANTNTNTNTNTT